MTSRQLDLRESMLPAELDVRSHGIVQTMLELEARCALYVMQRYYLLVEVAPILLRYGAEQWWRDAKRDIRYLADDLLEMIR